MTCSPLRVVVAAALLACCKSDDSALPVLPNRLLGLRPCAEAPAFIHCAASAPLQFVGAELCVGWTADGDCDGRCLVTAACNGSRIPHWTAEPNANKSAVHLRNKAGNTCIDYEDKVAHLQNFPVCTKPFGNQAFEVVPQAAPHRIKLKALFTGGGADVCIAALTDEPKPSPLRPPNATLSTYWRPLWHMTGFGLDLPGGHLQDPSAPYQDPATKVWHVFSDCTAGTWNPSVIGHDPKEFAFLGWCRFTSPDLVRWTSRGPAVWFDNTSVSSNGSGFGGNCGTGGGAVNAKGELIVYCPHDDTGIYVFAAKNASSLGTLQLSPRPPPGQNCTSPGFNGCAMLQPPPAVIREKNGGTSDPGTPFIHTDGETYTVWGSRNQPRGVTIFLYKAPSGDASLRKFEFNSVLFGRNFTPAQWCESYGPPPSCAGCACAEAYGGGYVGSVECPDFFPIPSEQGSADNSKQLMIIGSLGLGQVTSPNSSVGLPVTAWWSSSQAAWTPGKEFQPRAEGMLDYGSFYAPKSTSSADGKRRILFAWATERWCDGGDEYGWCGSHDRASLPPIDWDGAQAMAREMTVDDRGALLIRPVIEAQTLRDAAGSQGVQRLTLKPGQKPLRITSGRSLELRLNATMPHAGATVALHVLASGTLEERTTIIFDGSERKLIVATAHSSVGRTGARSPYKASLKNIASPGEPLVIAVYVDHSIVEVFVNSRIALTARAYPVQADSLGVLALATGQEATLSLQAWRLQL